MKKRSSSLPLVVLVAVVALVIGSFGTATAAGLTPKQVKKIAAKVVKKKAKTLTVANATKLNGAPASTYLTQVYTFPISPVGVAATSKTFTFTGLPAGNYELDFNVVGAMGTAGDLLRCFAQATPTSTTNLGLVYGGANGAFSTANSSVYVPGANNPRVICTVIGAGTFNVYAGADFPSSATFTKVDTTTAGTTIGARPAGSDTAGRP